MRAVFCAVALVGCSSSAEQKTATTPTAATGPSDAELRVRREREERIEREAIVSKHRGLEVAQQDALGATCKDPVAWAKQHCAPTCYPPEPKDPRAGTKVAGNVEVQHHVCQREDEQFVVIDEIDPKLKTRAFKKRFPRPPKKGTWQAELATWFAEHQVGKLARRDAITIVGTWKPLEHPLTKEPLECVRLVHYTAAPRGKLDDCGARGKTACEATGNAAARGINLVHYRLAQARQLQSAGNDAGCAEAALEAVATARGMPRWRQYAKLNVGQWTEGLAYRTRFDGTLDEDSLFAAVATLGAAAEQLYMTCALTNAVTKPEQEHAFHSCP
jgi:hypothetical protein